MEDERKDTELVKYEKYYSEEGLKDKITAYAKKAGSKVIYPVLLLFYVYTSKNQNENLWGSRVFYSPC